jgi:hypothetical protein
LFHLHFQNILDESVLRNNKMKFSIGAMIPRDWQGIKLVQGDLGSIGVGGKENWGS